MPPDLLSIDTRQVMPVKLVNDGSTQSRVEKGCVCVCGGVCVGGVVISLFVSTSTAGG